MNKRKFAEQNIMAAYVYARECWDNERIEKKEFVTKTDGYMAYIDTIVSSAIGEAYDLLEENWCSWQP